MIPSISRVAYLHLVAKTPDLKHMLRDLQSLSDLSENLDTVLDTFEHNFRMASLDPEVSSQMAALQKARQGLKKAQEIQKGIEEILSVYPEDKTAQRALKDAVVMVRRFQKHAQDAHKMLQSIAKKQIPKALQDLAQKAQAAMKRRLEDPRSLVVIPWQIADKDYRSGREGVRYQVVFRLNDNSSFEMILSQSTLDTKGPQLMGLGVFGSFKAADLKMILDEFERKLQGWAGLKGQADANAQREALAGNIVMALRSAWRGAEFSTSAREVRVSWREESLESLSEWDRDRKQSAMSKEFKDKAERLLKPYMSGIARIWADYAEKGWWSLSIQLK